VRFVIDAPVAIRLASDRVAIPEKHIDRRPASGRQNGTMNGPNQAAVSPEERVRMARQGAALVAEEIDDEGTPDRRADTIESLDRLRDSRGIPPLLPWWATKTEPRLHERARALGLLTPLR